METKTLQRIHKALADRTRLDILQEVARHGTRSCDDIHRLTGLSQPTVSHHLKILSEADLLHVEKEGRYLTLSINGETIGELLDFWTTLKR